MTAKFPGTCTRCHQPILVGQEIDWQKGAGATHRAGVCQATPLPEPEGDLKTVVDHLYAQSRVGKLYEKKGSLSDRQIAVVLARLTQGQAPKVQAPQLPDGRYAVTVDGNVRLVHVWHPRGKPEVQRLYPVTGHDDKGGKALYGQEELAVAKAIAADPAQAAMEFGHRTGHCFRCGAELDVNLSRSMGVGPTCVKHVMDDETRYATLAAHRAHLRAHGIDPAGAYDVVPPFVKPQAVAA
jgi:hypothetical protein